MYTVDIPRTLRDEHHPPSPPSRRQMLNSLPNLAKFQLVWCRLSDVVLFLSSHTVLGLFSIQMLMPDAHSVMAVHTVCGHGPASQLYGEFPATGVSSSGTRRPLILLPSSIFLSTFFPPPPLPPYAATPSIVDHLGGTSQARQQMVYLSVCANVLIGENFTDPTKLPSH